MKTHGVMDFSPLVKEHPDWFRGSHGAWPTTTGTEGTPIWTTGGSRSGVIDAGVCKMDGFRLKTWISLGRTCGREFGGTRRLPGRPSLSSKRTIRPFLELRIFRSTKMQSSTTNRRWRMNCWLKIYAGFYDRKFGQAGLYRVVIQYSDGSQAEGSSDGQGALKVHLDGLTADKAPHRKEYNSWYMPDGIPDVQLTVENVIARPIENVTVTDDALGSWRLNTGGGSRRLALEGEAPSLKLYIATIGHGWPTIQLSCHDQGWDGFPLDRSPYTAQGSRALMGYSCLFAPAIPIFFSGKSSTPHSGPCLGNLRTCTAAKIPARGHGSMAACSSGKN